MGRTPLSYSLVQNDSFKDSAGAMRGIWAVRIYPDFAGNQELCYRRTGKFVVRFNWQLVVRRGCDSGFSLN